MPEGPSEDVVLRSLARGEARSAEILVDRYWELAYRVAFLLLHDRGAAEEVAQDALLSAIRTIDRFELGRPFAPWLQRIAANRACDVLRHRRRRPEMLVEEVAAVDEHAEAGLADAVARAALSGDLLDALRRLQPAFRTPVVLRHLLDYAPAEIAEIVGVPAATVRTRIHRGLDRLRENLSTEEGADAHERAR